MNDYVIAIMGIQYFLMLRRFTKALLKGLEGRLRDHVLDLVLLAAGILYLLFAAGIFKSGFSFSKLIDGKWEAEVTSAFVISLFLVIHSFQAAYSIAREIKAERENDRPHFSAIISPSGTPYVNSGILYPWGRAKVWGIAFILVLIAVGLPYLVWLWVPIDKTTESLQRKEESPPLVRPKPAISLTLALITTIHRMRDPQTHGDMKGGQNDLFGVLRVRQENGVSVRHVKSLQVVGDEKADFDLFTADFGKNDGTETDDDLEGQYVKLKPFFSLSWIVFPASQEGIDPNDEKFIKFAISRTMGAIVFEGKDRKGSYGFETKRTKPAYLMTSPVWSQLVHFTQTNPGDMTGIYPALRDEVKSGNVKLRVDLDGELINIPVREIKFPWAVSLSENAINGMSPQELFYGIDRGERENLPRGKDSLVPTK